MVKSVSNPRQMSQLFAYENDDYLIDHSGAHGKSSSRKPGLADIIEILYSEHAYFDQLLSELAAEAEKLKPAKIPDYHLLEEIIDYLTHYPDRFHHPREDLLFRDVLAHDSDFKPQLDRLEREHQTLYRYNQALLERLKRITSGRPGEGEELRHSINRYIESYRKHMDFESREIFPRARGTLSAADREKLSQKTRYLDDPLFGAELAYRYRRLGRRFRDTVETAAGEISQRELSSLESATERLSRAMEQLSEVRRLLGQLSEEAWRERKATFGSHTDLCGEHSIFRLPGALWRDDRRRLGEGRRKLRRIFDGDDRGQPVGQTGPVSGA